MRSPALYLGLALCLALACLLASGHAEAPKTGPETEKRFPPLRVPPGFKATLFACDPLIEYPSAIAAGPKPGSLFVAIDYMTGLGEEIVRRDEVRLVEDTDGDGYADKATVVARGLNSVQGLAYHRGTLYVMHAPYLSAFTLGKGEGERRDLVKGLGRPPEQDKVRLHNANGVVVGQDGWLYLALGDHGCDVQRPEGDRLVLQGGGILRCRPDGRDLHVFASGLRNIYDIALDADLDVFLRDNENDGGNYKVRVYHSFFGADHGYPYHYEERPDEALTPLADLGLGSSAGGVCYLEHQFPAEYRGDLFFCEWGRSVVRYHPERRGSGFGPVKEIEFAAGAENDPYGFKPTDLVVERDGSLMVADWADGQRPRRGRGRIYRISFDKQRKPVASPAEKKGLEHWLAQLDSPGLADREEAQEALERLGGDGRSAIQKALKAGQLGVLARLHAVWILARGDRATAVEELFALASSDAAPRVQAQAVRALADLVDPVLVKHRLDAGPGDAELARRIAALAPHDPHVLLEVVIALGRLRWAESPDWLVVNVKKPDAALAHAVMQTLRRSGNSTAVLKLLDQPDTDPMRAIALRAVSEQAELPVVDGLMRRLKDETNALRRRQYADALSRVARKPGPWAYWGFRPAPRPANTVAWERTDAIEAALDRVLTDPNRVTRVMVLQRMRREKIAVKLDTIAPWLGEERDAARVAALIECLADHAPSGARELLMSVVQDRAHSAANRLAALALFGQGLDADSEAKMLALAEALEDGPVSAAALRELGKHPHLKSVPLLKRRLSSKSADVRAAALDALAELRSPEGNTPATELLADADPRVRQAAAAAAGKLAVRTAVDGLLKTASDTDAGVRRASFEALRLLREPRVLPLAVAGLGDASTRTAAVDCIADLGGPEHAPKLVELSRRNPSPDLVARCVHVLVAWAGKEGVSATSRNDLDTAVAEIQAASGSLVHWRVAGPVQASDADSLVATTAKPAAPFDTQWRAQFATGNRLRVGRGKAPNDAVWIAVTDLAVAAATNVEFKITSIQPLAIWLNGKPAHRHAVTAAGGSRFTSVLAKGSNRLLVRGTGPEFQVSFRRQSAKVEHEKLTAAALGRRGDVERGKKLFLNVEKSLCLKCHRLDEQGERIGPELTGIGARFARAYLVESILEPSRTIAPSFDTITVALKNGKVVSGIKVAETPQALTLADSQGQKQVVQKADIEERYVSPLSTMPEELEKRFTEQEFLDLIEFLVSQKTTRTR
jgi:putative membrane-bound dehydrogenase-like protein